MKTQTLPQLLAATPFFEGMAEEHVAFVAGCAHNVHLQKGEYLLLEGKEADRFFVVREGLVALEIGGSNRLATLQTIGAGQVVGWSWLVPPYTWHYDARVLEPVSAVSFDAVCVREKCARDAAFGFAMFERIARLMVQRLMATRYQLIDVYH